MERKIYYHHTDCGGVVYYSIYLNFLEEARTEYLEERGVILKDLIKEGTQFAVYRQEIDYNSPAVYGDTIKIDTQAKILSRTRLEFDCRITNQDNKSICEAKTFMACLKDNFKPKAIPDHIVSRILQETK